MHVSISPRIAIGTFCLGLVLLTGAVSSQVLQANATGVRSEMKERVCARVNRSVRNASMIARMNARISKQLGFTCSFDARAQSSRMSVRPIRTTQSLRSKASFRSASADNTSRFPEQIGEYVLQSINGQDKVLYDAECEKSDENTELCSDTWRTWYRRKSGGEVVDVRLLIITKGDKDYVRSELRIQSTPVPLDGYSLMRGDDPELFWFTDSKYDLIVAREGSWDEPNQTAVFYFSTGNNPVTRYFLEKYPPAQ